MKKFLKSLTAVLVAIVVVFGFAACGPKLSATTVDTSKVKTLNGVTTNGGISTIYDGYLYFINGTKTNDGTSSTNTTRGAVYRVKIDDNGVIDDQTYERVVSDLVGYEDGSLNFFGDFMYYTTPCTDVNRQGTKLYNKTKFVRYDLVNKSYQDIYTTAKNSADETVTYKYYIKGETLNLVVYESESATIKSFRIDSNITENYTINNVQSCLMSENYGKSKSSGNVTDANAFVFFTQNPSSTSYGDSSNQDAIQTGVKVFRTSPDKNDSYMISNDGKSITLLSIRQGGLIYSSEDTGMIYFHKINGTANDRLTFEYDIVSAEVYSDAPTIFLENEDGTISLLYYNSTTTLLTIVSWNTNVSGNSYALTYSRKDLCLLGESPTFLTTTTLSETTVVQDADESAGTPEQTKTEQVTYLIYTSSSIVYKLELYRKTESGELVYPNDAEAYSTQLSETTVEDVSGLLVAEAMGDYLYIYAKRTDEDGDSTEFVYLHRIDLTTSEFSDLESDDRKATMIGVVEDGEDDKTE